MTAAGPVLQLTLEGGAVPHPPPSSRLTPAQREILRECARAGAIRSFQAGAIIHAHRDPPVGESKRRYRANDGLAALMRLARRGLVRRTAPGRWELGG